MAGGTPCRGYDPVRRTTGRTGLSDRRERRRAGFGDDEFHPGELPGGGNFRCRSAGGVENRFRFWPGGVFFGFRRFGLFGRSVLPVNRGPCLYIVRKKTPAYAKTLRFFIRECCICAKIRYICTGLRTISVFVRGDRAGWVFRMVLRSAVLCTLFNPI